jgi:hypothetical protein
LNITINVKPIDKNIKALYDLCFLNPKHKLVIPIVREKAKNNHSISSVTKSDKPITGKTTTIKGKREQWIAHNKAAINPTLSNLLGE